MLARSVVEVPEALGSPGLKSVSNGSGFSRCVQHGANLAKLGRRP